VALPKILFPALSTVAKRLVELAVVEKKLVVVAAEPVALMKVKFCSVDEPVARKLVVEAKVKRPEVTVRRLVLGLKVKPLLPVIEEAPLKYETWLAIPEPETEPEPMQEVPIAKHPEVILIPFANVEVALPVTLRAAALTPAVKVEEAAPETVSVVPTLYEPVVVPLPFTKVLPSTERREVGVVEPIPTKPLVLMEKADIEEVAKVEALEVAR
jgi:hypothetical protein